MKYTIRTILLAFSGAMVSSVILFYLVVWVMFAVSQVSFFNSDSNELASYDFEEQLQVENVKRVDVSKNSEGLYRFEVELKEDVDGVTSIEFTTDEYKTEWNDSLAAQQIPADVHARSNLLAGFLINILPLVLIFAAFWGIFGLLIYVQSLENKQDPRE